MFQITFNKSVNILIIMALIAAVGTLFGFGTPFFFNINNKVEALSANVVEMKETIKDSATIVVEFEQMQDNMKGMCEDIENLDSAVKSSHEQMVTEEDLTQLRKDIREDFKFIIDNMH